MGKRRSIDSKIRASQTFSELSYRQRDLWHGLIVSADDQGRLPGVSAYIRSTVFPYDDISLGDIQQDILALAAMGNIHTYKVNDQEYIQIVKWWKYQNMQWAGRSDYPAPENWSDRERFHGPGRKIHMLNWDTEGGFNDVKDKDNVKDNVNVKPRGLPLQKASDKGRPLPLSDTIIRQFSDAFTAKTTILPHNNQKWVEAIEDLIVAGLSVEDMNTAIDKMDTDGLTISGPWSIVKVAISENGRKKRGVKPVTMYADATEDDMI